MALFTQLTRVVHTPVGCGIDLDHIEGRLPTPDPGAALTLAAGLTRVLPPGTVEGHGEDASEGGLTHPTRTTEEVGVSDSTARHGATQGLGDVLLSRHIGESPRAILSGQGCVGHGRTLREPAGVAESHTIRKMPQATRSNDHCTYRCYRQGPDGVREAFALRTWGTGKLECLRRSVNGWQCEKVGIMRVFALSAHSIQAPSMCSTSTVPAPSEYTETASNR